MIIEYFNFIILIQSLALFIRSLLWFLKKTRNIPPPKKSKPHFSKTLMILSNYELDFYSKNRQKNRIFSSFFSSKKKFFSWKKCFLSKRKLKISKWGRFSKSWKVMVKIKNFPEKNLEKVDHVIVSKWNFQRIPSIFFKSPVN